MKQIPEELENWMKEIETRIAKLEKENKEKEEQMLCICQVANKILE